METRLKTDRTTWYSLFAFGSLNYEALITKSNNKIEFDFQSVLEKQTCVSYIVKRAFFKQHSKAINRGTSLLARIIISKFICHYRITKIVRAF